MEKTRKANVITALALTVVMLAAMTGIAAATIVTSPDHVDVNVNTNAATDVTITFTGLNVGDLCRFTIFDDSTSPSSPSTELQGSFDGAIWDFPSNSGNEASPDSVTYNIADNNYTSVWDFQIKDNGDGNDATQMDKEYTIQFEIFNATVGVSTYHLGATTTGVTAVPEFATIAIPVAAILGLVLFFNHRKRKRE